METRPVMATSCRSFGEIEKDIVLIESVGASTTPGTTLEAIISGTSLRQASVLVLIGFLGGSLSRPLRAGKRSQTSHSTQTRLGPSPAWPKC
ncbi:hypothetical protein E2C01_102879 [Portunus trituberculatus]|uniref:Uncharacterized protein n=1 Tax=Portunus trituberculatus TaxID=210409 RepID=A0A5B7KNK1_PORTR|nr:hypothetical protein [Portunus trituberculatus]